MLELREDGTQGSGLRQSSVCGKRRVRVQGKRERRQQRGERKGKGECWNCGEAGHRFYDRKGCGKDSWQQQWQNGARSICGLTESKAKADEEGLTAVKPETSAKTAASCPAPQTPVLDCRPVLRISGGAFERLQEDEEDEEEESRGSRAKLAYTKKRGGNKKSMLRKRRPQRSRRHLHRHRPRGKQEAVRGQKDATRRCQQQKEKTNADAGIKMKTKAKMRT